jgi:hypothetical protein
MEQNDLRQSDVPPIFGSRGYVSAVVNGKRAISKTHAKGLCCKNSLTIQDVVTKTGSSLLQNVAKIFFATEPGFFSFNTARRAISGYEVMNIIRKGQIE